MTIVAIFSIMFMLLQLTNLTCGIIRFNKSRIFSLFEIIIPALSLLANAALCVSQFIETNWLFAVSYSLSFLLFPSIIPFVIIRSNSPLESLPKSTTIIMIIASVIGIISGIAIGALL